METSIRVKIAMGQISTATTAPPYPEASQGVLFPAVTVPLILPAVHFAVMARATVMRPLQIVWRIVLLDPPVTMETSIRARIATGQISVALLALLWDSLVVLSPAATVCSILPDVREYLQVGSATKLGMAILSVIADVE
jgi:hypothetical protein